MVARQVGEDGGVKMQAVHAPELQRVRRHFHGSVIAAHLLQFRQRAESGPAIREWCSRPAAPVPPDDIRWCRSARWYGPRRAAPNRSGNPVVVLPLVPVMPVRPRRSSGCAVEIARGERERVPSMLHLNPARRHIRSGAGVSLAIAMAPFAKASCGELTAIGARAGKREKQKTRSLRGANRNSSPVDFSFGKLRREWL